MTVGLTAPRHERRELDTARIAEAARHRVVLHALLVVRRATPMHLLLGLGPTRPAALAHLARAAALDVHVAVHRTAGYPQALAAAVAETVGAELRT